MADKESAAADRAAAHVDRTAAPQGTEEQRGAVTDFVVTTLGTVAGTGLAAGAKIVGGAAIDKVTGQTGGDHKAEKGDG